MNQNNDRKRQQGPHAHNSSKQVNLSSQKKEFIKSIVKQLRPMFLDYALYGMWLAQQDQDYRNDQIKRLKSIYLQKQIDTREVAVNIPTENDQRNVLNKFLYDAISAEANSTLKNIDNEY